jgi:uncharacterized membrane protein
MKSLIPGVLLLSLSTLFVASNPSVAQNKAPENFLVSGTEPFWSVKVAKTGIVFSTPEMTNLRFPYVKPLGASGRPLDVVRVYQLRGRSSGTLVLKKVDACSDGMSDNKYPYSATLILGNRVFDGCARVGK